jgi:para-nitrobenzyl esterase
LSKDAVTGACEALMSRSDVEVESGTVRGEVRDGVRVFKGIPYAAPPVGDLRFAAPQPPTRWSGVRDAFAFAERSLQRTFAVGGSSAGAHELVGSEDCLYLNVYAPAEPGHYPVMVWMHGGGAVTGSTNDSDGTRFAQDGVVVVTIAYRLGALGLLHLPGVFDDDVHCNFALLDQVAALGWVHENIAAFGGDSERVTIAGLSNGGRSVANLLAMPSAGGLIQQAVIMSATGVGYLVATPEEAQRVTAAVLAELGLDLAEAAKLREIPAADIVAAQTRVSMSWPTLLPFQAVVDGTTMPERPIDAIAAGAAKDIRLIVGTTHDEWDVLARVASNIGGMARGTSVLLDDGQLEQAESAYRRLLPPDWSDEDVRRHVITSSEWWIPAIRLAEAQIRAGGEAWMYRLDWRLAPRGQGFGAPHGLDLPLMAPTDPQHAMMLAVAGVDRAQLDPIIDQIGTALTRFFTTGDPSGEQWPAYDLAARSTYVFDDPPSLAGDPERDLRLVWRELIT